jgi:hypothetical protein
MVSNVTTCHAPAPEPSIPAALSQRSALAARASDVLIPSHAYGAAVAVTRSAARAASRARSGAGYAAVTTRAGTTKATTPKATAPRTTIPKASSAPTTPAALAFLDDKNLSLEDKLMRLLAYLNDRWEKDIEKKMREASGTDGKAATSSSSSGIGGALGKLVGIAKDAFPPAGLVMSALQNPTVRGVVSKVAGPALAGLATTAGFPELAPLALRYGPSIIDSAAGAVTAPLAGTGSSTAGAKADGSTSDSQTQLKFMEIQRLLDQQKQMFSLVSNMLHSRQELRMGVIQNIR